jgi:flagellar motor switch protein FliG
MGESQAAEVMKHLNHKQVQRLGSSMAVIANVSRDEIQTVMLDFIQQAEKQTSLGVGSEDYIKRVLVSALGTDIAGGLINRIFTSSNDIQGLDALKWMDARAVADIIRNEHPQVTAIVLTYLDSEQAAQILSSLPQELGVELMLRMASLESIEPAALQELNSIIEKQFAGNKRKSTSLGGAKNVADIMNSLERSMESKIMDGIKEFNEELSLQIQDLMFVFDNLNDVDDRSIQVILREAPSEVLILALKAADEGLKEKIFKNMSQRAADMLRDDLEAKGPVRLKEVESAQKQILGIARKLADAGEIVLGKGGEQMI